jgi:hypothetical protein
MRHPRLVTAARELRQAGRRRRCCEPAGRPSDRVTARKGGDNAPGTTIARGGRYAGIPPLAPSGALGRELIRPRQGRITGDREDDFLRHAGEFQR